MIDISFESILFCFEFVWSFELYIRHHESDQTSKSFNADIHGSIAILFAILAKRLSRKHNIETLFWKQSFFFVPLSHDPSWWRHFMIFFLESLYVSRRLMGIEPMTVLYLLLVCEIINNGEWRDQNFYQLFALSYLGMRCWTCHGRNLYRTVKIGTL